MLRYWSSRRYSTLRTLLLAADFSSLTNWQLAALPRDEIDKSSTQLLSALLSNTSIYTYVNMLMYAYVWKVYTHVASFECPLQRRTRWPLHDIVVTNIVWCMAYKREVEEGSYTAR